MKRRQYIGGMAGLAAFSALPTVSADVQSLATTRAVGDSYHPGPPRLLHAGQKLVDPLTPDYRDDGAPDGRDTLAPRIPEPQRDSEEYDYGGNVEEFDPDVPGTYALELDAPDGTHELTVRVYPEPPEGAGGPPTVNISATAENGAFVIETEPQPAPNSDVPAADLDVEFFPDDRDSLGSEDIAGGIAYAARRLLGDSPGQPDDIDDQPQTNDVTDADAATAASRSESRRED